MENLPRHVIKFVDKSGYCPFDNWFDSLKDKKTKAIIATRINRLIQGNFGLCRGLGESISELKIDFGPGYRVYFSESGKTLVIILCGGDKSSQQKDIQKAFHYWHDYQRRKP